MRAGALNKRITLQNETKVSDSMGGFNTTWTDVATIWAGIWALSASEALQSMQTTMRVTHRIRMRYRRNVEPSSRIKFGNRYFNIRGILNPNEANETLDLMAEEVT